MGRRENDTDTIELCSSRATAVCRHLNHTSYRAWKVEPCRNTERPVKICDRLSTEQAGLISSALVTPESRTTGPRGIHALTRFHVFRYPWMLRLYVARQSRDLRWYEYFQYKAHQAQCLQSKLTTFLIKMRRTLLCSSLCTKFSRRLDLLHFKF